MYNSVIAVGIKWVEMLYSHMILEGKMRIQRTWLIYFKSASCHNMKIISFKCAFQVNILKNKSGNIL